MKRILALCFLFSCNNNSREPVVFNQHSNNNTTADTHPVKTASPYAAPVDQSPLDFLYYPIDFPKLKSQGKAGPVPDIRIIYSRPQRHNRVIFGGLQPYGAQWRMGANEATEIELFRNAFINGKPLSKGRYIMYCIPEEKEWTIVFNSAVYTWGLQFDPKDDVLRIKVPVEKLPEPVEVFSMYFQQAEKKAMLIIEWDLVRVMLSFDF